MNLTTQYGFRGRHFNLNLDLCTGEKFQLKNVNNEMKIKKLKSILELVAGLPSHIQRLSYLDEGDLINENEIKFHDIVPDATVNLAVWNMWTTLVKAAAIGNIEKVFELGVTIDTRYSTPNSERMDTQAREEWIAERAFVALCIAAHRGHSNLVIKLIEGGANVYMKTSFGRSALHIAAAQGKNNCVEILLNNGARIDDPDIDGNTPLQLAALWGHKSCERQIFLFQWQQRAATMKPIKDDGKRMAHQIYDSKTPTWLKGDYGRLYFAEILPPGEYSGSKLDSPLKNKDSTGHSGQMYEHSGQSKKLGNNQPFELWLAKKEAAEKSCRNRKRIIKAEKKIIEEEERRAASAKEKTYDSWLREQKMRGKSPDRKLSPDDKGFDLTKIRKEMDIFNILPMK